jgi:hypothetical protein
MKKGQIELVEIALQPKIYCALCILRPSEIVCVCVCLNVYFKLHCSIQTSIRRVVITRKVNKKKKILKHFVCVRSTFFNSFCCFDIEIFLFFYETCETHKQTYRQTFWSTWMSKPDKHRQTAKEIKNVSRSRGWFTSFSSSSSVIISLCYWFCASEFSILDDFRWFKMKV